MKKGNDLDLDFIAKKAKKSNRFIVVLGKIIFFIMFIGLLAGFIWSYRNLQDTKKQISRLSSNGATEENKLTKEQEADLINKIKKHIMLPEDEQPVIAEIGNIEKLLQSEPVFYKNAKNGNIVLIYEKNQKAFIYDKENDFIVNTGSVVIGDEEKTSDSQTPQNNASSTTEEKKSN